MKRRRFVAVLGSAVMAWPVVGDAQPAGKVARIGLLGFGTALAWAPRVEALRAGFRDLGYVEGRNLAIEFRWAETVEQLSELAADLVRMNVDVIFANSSTEVEIARRATTTIPIVFAAHADPVGLGHVASLSRPGGNVTGLSAVLTDLVAKDMEILKETLPQATRIGVLYSLAAPSHAPALQAIAAAGQRLGVQVTAAPLQTVADIESAFATMKRELAGGFLVPATTFTLSHRALLAELALKHRLPGLFGARENVEAGGLMSYAPDHRDLTRRATLYIDKILKGAKPADLPIEQASKYQLVINLKAAHAIGVDIPESLLVRADEVIE